MTNDETLSLAHREAWRYKKSSDPHHSDTYTFNRSTLLEFARKLIAAERDACAAYCGRLAEMMEQGAGDPEPGGRLRQAEHTILAGQHYPWDERSNGKSDRLAEDKQEG